MLKGVTKQIIEINHPENESFEKVLLFLKSDADYTRPLFQKNCTEYIGSLKIGISRKARFQTFLKLLALAGTSAGCGALLMWSMLSF